MGNFGSSKMVPTKMHSSKIVRQNDPFSDKMIHFQIVVWYIKIFGGFTRSNNPQIKNLKKMVKH